MFETTERHGQSLFEHPEKEVFRAHLIFTRLSVRTRCVRILSKLRNGTIYRKLHPLPTEFLSHGKELQTIFA